MSEQPPKSLTPLQQDRRNRILQATRDQLAVQGYDGLNMRTLAVAADVSTATLYNLYHGKDALILAALADLLARLVDVGEVRGIERLVRQLDRQAAQIEATPTYADAMSRMLFNANAEDDVVSVVMEGGMVNYLRCLNEMRDDGLLLPDVDLKELARDFNAANWGCILLWLKGFIALRDFHSEYRRMVLMRVLASANPRRAKKIRDYLE